MFMSNHGCRNCGGTSPRSPTPQYFGTHDQSLNWIIIPSPTPNWCTDKFIKKLIKRLIFAVIIKKKKKKKKNESEQNSASSLFLGWWICIIISNHLISAPQCEKCPHTYASAWELAGLVCPPGVAKNTDPLLDCLFEVENTDIYCLSIWNWITP